MLWNLLLIATSLACEDPVTAPELLDSLGRAESSWTQLDREGFSAAVAQLRFVLPCLSEALTAADAAAIHRVEALDAFLVGDRDASARAYSAAARLEPAYELPLGIAPAGNPLRSVWLEGRALSAGPTRELARPSSGALVLDGTRSLRRPETRPVIFQRIDAQGRVVDSAYLVPGEPTPLYRTWTSSDPPGRPAVTRTTEHRPLVAVAAVAGVASGAMWALSLRSADTFWDPNTPQEDLAGLRLQTDGLIVGAVGAGAGAAATGVMALWVWQR